MSLSINPAKLFKSGKFMMTAAATIAVVASATATTLTSINADDSVAPAKVTTSQKAEPQENHMYKGHRFDAPIRVETHDIWTANSESVIADNMSKQGIKSVDQLGDYKVVWGDTLSTIAAHFNVSVEELAQRFHIVDVNYIGAGVTMNAQRNLNELESQVIHDAQWEGQYNAKVAASQASDGADAQADATAATHDATPATNAPVANADAPAQAAKSSDTHIGGASDVINNIADGTKTNQTPAVTPADKPATDAPATNAPTSAAPSSAVPSTPVEVQSPASEAPKTDTPATNAPTSAAPSSAAPSTPAEAQKPASEAPKTDTPATNAPTSAAPSSAVPSTPVEVQSPASEAPGANDNPVYDAPMSHEVPANPVDGSTFEAISSESNSSFGLSYGVLTYHTSFSGYSISDLTHGAYQGLWFDHSGNAVDPYKAYSIFYTKQDVDNLVTRYIDAQTPIKGTESEGPDGLVGTTYHTSFSGYSVSDLTNGKYQGLSLDSSGNALDPDYPVRILYTKQDINNLVTRYIDELVGGASSVIKSIG